MKVHVLNRHHWHIELRSQPNLSGVPLAGDDATRDLAETIDEAITNSWLGDYLPTTLREVTVQVEPVFRTPPVVERIDVTVSAGSDTQAPRVTLPFTSGNWNRWSQRKVLELREEGSLASDQTAFQMLLALPSESAVDVPLPPFRAPEIRTATLEECGVYRLLEGEVTPDRPLLVSTRFEEEAIAQCERSKEIEIGAAVLGRCVRLNEPLPGARTAVTTIFSTLVFDVRHSGDENQFHFHPAALAEAQRLCDLRGLGESLLTVFHTHGWGCGECNQKTVCAIAEAKPSLQDYQLLGTLFPGKSTLMPIAGRKVGDESRRPVLQIYAWRAGQMRPIRWRRFED